VPAFLSSPPPSLPLSHFHYCARLSSTYRASCLPCSSSSLPSRSPLSPSPRPSCSFALARPPRRPVPQPREALLKYATADPNDNTWTKAWAATQPKTVFDERPDPEDDVEEKRGR